MYDVFELLKRLRAARRALEEVYGRGDDEWTETFRPAARLAGTLADSLPPENRRLAEHLVRWLEWAASKEAGGEGGAPPP